MVAGLGQTLDIDSSADYEFLYQGLSRQNIDSHQAIAELVDNAISGRNKPYFMVEILLNRKENLVEVTVADDGSGIAIEDLQKKVLKLGGIGTKKGDLNEHGFGLKNSLCLLTGNNRPFALLTADAQAAQRSGHWLVEGPFKANMQTRFVSDPRWTSNLSHVSGTTGTRVIALTTLSYLRTLYPRGSVVSTLAIRLAEHLGVFYRHWLGNDPRNQIWIKYEDGSGAWQEILVPSVTLPLSDDHESHSIELDVDGKKARARYVVGWLDERKLNGPGPVYPLQIYYQHNERTQGVDVIVRNKVILPHELEKLWPGQLRRRERNFFLGELRLEGDDFRTVNSKTDLDPHDPFWVAIKDRFDPEKHPELRPPSYQVGREEAAITEALKDLLEKFHSGTSAHRNYPIWSGVGVKADIVHQDNAGTWLHVYEIKDDIAAPQDVYQLIMYWDGLVDSGKSPTIGRLVAESAPDSVITLLKHWNNRTDLKGNPYKVEFKSIADLGVRVVTRGTGKQATQRMRRR